MFSKNIENKSYAESVYSKQPNHINLNQDQLFPFLSGQIKSLFPIDYAKLIMLLFQKDLKLLKTIYLTRKCSNHGKNCHFTSNYVFSYLKTFSITFIAYFFSLFYFSFTK